MNKLHHRRTRRVIVIALTGALALPLLGAVAPVTAAAANHCTQTLKNQDHTGAMTVAAAGKLCLINVHQTGDLTVPATSSLKVIDSKVIGSITLQDGFSNFKMCHSKTTLPGGNISGTGATGKVLIGKLGSSCRGNTIAGAVSLTSSSRGMLLAHSHLLGALTVTGTSGGDGSMIAGNTMSAITCTSNDPDPVNNGESNTTSARTGETCADPEF